MVDASPNLTLWVALLVLPLALALATAFTKTSVVLGALRLGLAAEALLPLPVVFALSLLVTVIVMLPTGSAVVDALGTAGGLDAVIADADRWTEVLAPLRSFLQRHADPAELRFFSELQDRAIDDPVVIVAAFVVTELAEAFAIAVALLVPFVVVDLLAAQGLALLGVVGQPRPLVTVPIKLLLFLAVGGWDLIIGGLVEGYR